VGRIGKVTEAEHQAKAREFVDSILEVNRRHGVDKESGVIEYDHAVDAAVSTFKRLRNDSDDQTGDEVRDTGAAGSA
jgi:hypothetical protein